VHPHDKFNVLQRTQSFGILNKNFSVLKEKLFASKFCSNCTGKLLYRVASSITEQNKMKAVVIQVVTQLLFQDKTNLLNILHNNNINA
jgi:hypothetical protein